MSPLKKIILTALIFFCTLNVGWVNSNNNFNMDKGQVNLMEKNYSDKLETFLKNNSKLNIEKVEKVNNAYVVTIQNSGENKTIPESYVNSYFFDRNSNAAESILGIVSTTGPK